MDNAPDIPWVYVAMVAIIFIQWVVRQFKAASERRREIMEQRMRGFEIEVPERRDSYSSYEEEEKDDDYYYEDERPQQPAAPQPQTLQELFEQRRREIAEAQRKVVVKPPPLPPTQPKPAASEPLPVFKNPEPITKTPPMASRRRSGTQYGQLFSTPSDLRKAFVLKEILDKPKALQD